MLLGSNEGYLFLRENQGTNRSAEFASESTQLKHDDQPLTTGNGHAMPFVADWDGDGRFDILSGRSDGGVVWFRNVGKKGEPEFELAKGLIETGRENADGSAKVGQRSQVAVGDYNQDGLLDVLVGDYSYGRSGIASLSEENQLRMKELTKEIDLLGQNINEIQGAIRAGEQSEELEEASKEDLKSQLESSKEQLKKLSKEYFQLRPKPTMHGYVWLFQRKS